MQTFIVFTLWTLLTFVVQTTLNLPIFRIWTDFLFFIVIILGLRYRYITAIVVTIIIGFFADLVSYVPNGITLTSYLLTLVFIRSVKANIYLESRPSLFFWIFVFSLFKQIVQLVLLKLYVDHYSFALVNVFDLLLQALWDSLLGLLIIPLLIKLTTMDFGMALRRKGLRD